VGQTITPCSLDDKWKKQWKRLISEYAEKAKKDLQTRKDSAGLPWGYLGREPGKTAFSRHIYEPGAEQLKPRDLCYARVDKAGKEIIGLYPVMIARELAEESPEEYLPKELRPAERREDLSSADRVFGWVRQRKEGAAPGKREAWRGQLRIAQVECKSSVAEAVRIFERPGLPLAILSTPKPEQARFYLAADREGSPQEGMDRDRASYRDHNVKRLRGRKVYPHHAALPAGYWDDPNIAFKGRQEPNVAQAIVGRYREFVRVAETESKLWDSQNRSILGWAQPGAQFTARIAVTNLTGAELGALLYLLSLPPEHFHRLGGGKPLGFGSARIDITALDLDDGAARAAEYATLLPDARDARAGKRHRVPAEADGEAAAVAIAREIAEAVKAFKDAIKDAYGAPFEAIRFIQAFHNAAKGLGDKPLHYPRPGLGPSVKPDSGGKNFEWFVANNHKNGPKIALDALWEPKGLPYAEEKIAGAEGGPIATQPGAETTGPRCIKRCNGST
jgi:CRISPR-associated protein (TIGR03986 family)